MPTFSLRSNWGESRELLTLDFGSLAPGKLVPTEELWKDGSIAKYQAEVVRVVVPVAGAPMKYRVELRYDEQAPQHEDSRLRHRVG